ncbi:hypothetical protein HK100_004085 [Physocladia obscura]|uniref:Uncharacterized protein n=1 Tax=Physocladia obscura TaxID=109957 RepID=A0AAD5XD74_9FUNG|nr:hypothetical protein HK100_004085 [Physocladia obscura]
MYGQQGQQGQYYSGAPPPPPPTGQGGQWAVPPQPTPTGQGGQWGELGGASGGGAGAPSQQPTYQGYVKGLHGWNDPPSLIGGLGATQRGTARKAAAATPTTASTATLDADALLASVDNPVSHVLVALTAAMDLVKQAVITDIVQRKMLDDTDRRLDELLERLAVQAVPDILLAHLILLANAFTAKNPAAAKKTAMTLTLMSTEHHEDAHWIVGAKRLVDMFDRFVVNVNNSQQQPQTFQPQFQQLQQNQVQPQNNQYRQFQQQQYPSQQLPQPQQQQQFNGAPRGNY